MVAAGSDPLDTDGAVVRLQVERWRSLTFGERMDLVGRLSSDAERMAIAGILGAHPGLSESELRRELVRRKHGPELADAAFGPTSR